MAQGIYPVIQQPTMQNPQGMVAGGMAPVGNFAGGYMPPMNPISGCPYGLEYLTMLDSVQIQQDISILEVLTAYEALNSYRILNSAGQQVYLAGEESNCCSRQLCRYERGFVYHITDNYQREVFRVTREFDLCAGQRWCPLDCCRYYAYVQDAAGNMLGYVSDRFTLCGWRPMFGIYDVEKNLTAEIRGPCCAIQNCICTNDIEFPVYHLNKGEEPSGMIAKTWEGMLKNCCTTADNYRVDFPVEMDVPTKVLMISAVLVIDMMMYEVEQQNQEGLTTTTF